MLLLRKILFYVFCLIFIIFCPGIIFYALGITFKPATQTILKTGLIHLTTIPSDARVYINNRPWPDKTPITIRNLAPNQYFIRIVKENYRSWARILPVVKEKATSIENILLLPKIWHLSLVSMQPFENVMAFQEQPFLITKSGPYFKDAGVFFFDNIKPFLTKKDVPENITESTFLKPLPLLFDLPEKSKIKRYFSVTQSRFLLLEIENEKQQQYFWVDFRSKDPVLKDISTLFTSSPDVVLWDPQEDHVLFVLKDNVIHQLDTDTMAIYPEVALQVLSFAVFDRHLYVLTEDHLIKRFASHDKEPEVLFDDKNLSAELFGKNEKWQMTVLPDNIMLFLNDKGALLTNHLPYRLVEEKVKGFSFHEKTKRLLVWTDREIGAIDFAEKAEETVFEKGPQLTWLTDKGRKIEQAFWANKGSYVLFQDNNRFFLLEAFKFRIAMAFEISGIEAKGPGAYYEKDGLLFFLNAQTKQLSFVEIVPAQRNEITPLGAEIIKENVL